MARKTLSSDPMPYIRGSANLTQGKALSNAELVKLVSLVKGKSVKVVDWTILGQPRPDAITGTLEVSASSVSKVVNGLLSIRSRRPRVEVFPLGIPVVRGFNVRFRV